MNNDSLTAWVAKKNRLRLAFSVLTWLFYGGFALGFGPLSDVFASTVFFGSVISFALFYFFFLVFVFVVLEFIFLKLINKLDEVESNE